MNKRLQGAIIGFIVGALLTGSVAVAKVATQSIQVNYNNIKVYKDKQVCTLKDANGNIVEPFIYNGTTYLPVRAVAELAGMDVTWDNSTKTVYLWQNMVPGAVNLLDVCPPYSTQYFKIHRSGSYFQMNGYNYTNGMFAETFSSSADFNLNGKYSTLECTIGHETYTTKDNTVDFIVDGKTVGTVTVAQGSSPVRYAVPLGYGKHLKIQVRGYGKGTGFADMVLK